MVMQSLLVALHAFLAWQAKDDQRTQGQGLVEYALILMFVAVVLVLLLVLLGPGLGNIYSNILFTLEDV